MFFKNREQDLSIPAGKESPFKILLKVRRFIEDRVSQGAFNPRKMDALTMGRVLNVLKGPACHLTPVTAQIGVV